MSLCAGCVSNREVEVFILKEDFGYARRDLLGTLERVYEDAEAVDRLKILFKNKFVFNNLGVILFRLHRGI